jgi:hypothetical protein
MINSPTFDAEDKPQGVLKPAAMSIGWLQEALDLFHHEFPFMGTMKKFPIVLISEMLPLPADFILDVRDGLVILEKGIVRQRDFRQMIDLWTLNPRPSVPEAYIIQPPNLSLIPTPDQPYGAILWYYALPAELQPYTVPQFPSDLILVEYVRLRANEWIRRDAPGTALAYAEVRIQPLHASGLLGEAEPSEVPPRPQTLPAHAWERHWRLARSEMKGVS